MATYRLIAKDGRLYFPTGDWENAANPSLLYRRYDAGDVNTCCWPIRNAKDKKILAHALYDERETNNTWSVREEAVIELPDGQPLEWEHLVD